MICDANVNLGDKDNMFGVLGGNVDDYSPLGYFRGYDPSIDPYYVCCLGKTTFLNPSYDFSKAFAKVKGILIVFGVILVIAFYPVFSKFCSQEFNMLLLF